MITREVALRINTELIKRAKQTSYSNAHKWKWKRCAMCCNEIMEGQQFLTFIPMDYKRWVKLETKVMHVNCLDMKDRNLYGYNRETATDAPPLLTDNWIYDIIQGKGD